MQAKDTRSSPTASRKLSIARETLRSLGSATMGKAAGGTLYDPEATTELCWAISGYLTGHALDWCFESNSCNPATSEGAGGYTYTCSVAMGCGGESVGCPLPETATCPGYGCLDPVVVTP